MKRNAVLVLLALFVLLPGMSSAQESKGTLSLTVLFNDPGGYLSYDEGTAFENGESDKLPPPSSPPPSNYWVYVDERIVARGMSRETRTSPGVHEIQLSPGTHRLEVGIQTWRDDLAVYDRVFPPLFFMRAGDIEIRIGDTTSVEIRAPNLRRFNASMLKPYSLPCKKDDHVLVDDALRLLQEDAAGLAADPEFKTLQEVRRALKRNPPTRGTVVVNLKEYPMQGTKDGVSVGYPHRFGAEDPVFQSTTGVSRILEWDHGQWLGRREYDPQQIRLLVQYLANRYGEGFRSVRALPEMYDRLCGPISSGLRRAIDSLVKQNIEDNPLDPLEEIAVWLEQ